MTKTIVGSLLLLALAGCSGYTVNLKSSSVCASSGEASHACQVERYNNVGGR